MNKKSVGKRIGKWGLIIILAAALVGLYTVESSRQAARTKQLKEEAAATNTDSATAIASNDSAVEIASPEDAERRISLSCRGDSFNAAEGADKTGGYPARLKDVLESNGITPTIVDDTWDMSGSLSHLGYAGVSQERINAYIAAHQEAAAANGIELETTEVQVRADLAELEINRQDQDMIPVICIGYNGGWNNDVNELIEQQQLLLDTYTQKEKFIIMGYYPNGFEDTAAYDQAMAEAWGEHYLPLNGTLSVLDFSDTERQEIAKAIYEKLVMLKYL